MVCVGFGHAFDLLAQVLRDRVFAVEDPGYPPPRARLARAGIPVEAVPVDGQGLVVERLRATAARVAVVTPAHQSPNGVPLSPRRRHELVDWARAVDGYVVEDDFDAEFRYDRRPVGALQGLAPDRVVYCGTTAKTLAAGLLLGYGAVRPEPAELGVRLLADAVRAITGPRAGHRRARVHLVDGASACAGSVVPP